MLRGEDEQVIAASAQDVGDEGADNHSDTQILGYSDSSQQTLGQILNGSSPRRGNGPARSLPNPAAQPVFFLGKDPDPMMQALLENMLGIEASLLELKMKAKLFLDSVDFLCRTMGDQAHCVARLCKDNSTLAAATSRFADVCSETIGKDSLSILREVMELKVIVPINVNLEVLTDIKARAHERDALRKKSKSFWSSGTQQQQSPEFIAITARLFEELEALNKHRYDVIRGIYDGLKACQRTFFATVCDQICSADLDLPPKATPTIAPPISITPSTLTLDESAGPSAATTTKKETIVPIAPPAASCFNPMLDKVNPNNAPAFQRFSNLSTSLEDVYDDDNVDDYAEYYKNKSSPNKKPVEQTRKIGDEEDELELDTV